MATIPTVVDNELIETSWGNLVAAELNALTVKNTGSQTMAGPLTVTGGSITVSQAAAGVALPSGEPSAANRAARKDYVDTGDAAATALANLRVPLTGGTMSGTLQVGGDPTLTINQVGIRHRPDGVMISRVENPSGATTANLSLIRAGTGPADVGATFLRFERHPSAGGDGVLIGSVTVIGGPGVAYNVTSDYRLKDVLGPIGDAWARFRKLHPIRGRWLSDPDAGEFDMLLAHEVAEVVPSAVCGVKDATTDSGQIVPQQLDRAALIPLIIATVLELGDRLDTLTAKAV